jgi:hypothetical protein
VYYKQRKIRKKGGTTKYYGEIEINSKLNAEGEKISQDRCMWSTFWHITVGIKNISFRGDMGSNTVCFGTDILIPCRKEQLPTYPAY